ncbi:hypothetical protein QE152_g31127 [Popillia japonica]|uniref:Uncharacterized protein n=1 Tax=Popillia japonica TaxID=7064 RepID=A0AAW1JDC3_POPJA
MESSCIDSSTPPQSHVGEPSIADARATTSGTLYRNELSTVHSNISAVSELVSPEQIRPFPKADARKTSKRGGRKPGRCRILTDTPEKNEIEKQGEVRKQKIRQETRKIESSSSEEDEELSIDPDDSLQDVEFGIEEEEDINEELYANDFILVRLCGKKSYKFYIAQIIQTGEPLEVKYLKKVGINTFICLDETLYELQTSEVVMKLPCPFISGGTERKRRQMNVSALLSLGHKFAFKPSKKDIDIGSLLADTEDLLCNLGTDIRNDMRAKITNVFTNYFYNSYTDNFTDITLRSYYYETKRFLKLNSTTPDPVIITRAHKGSVTVAINTSDYIAKANEFLHESDVNLLDLLTEIPGCEAIDNDVTEWVNSDDLELEYTDDDIVDMVMQPEDDDAANEEDNTSDAADDKRVTAEEGFNVLDVSRKYVDHGKNHGKEYHPADPKDVEELQRMMFEDDEQDDLQDDFDDEEDTDGEYAVKSREEDSDTEQEASGRR